MQPWYSANGVEIYTGHVLDVLAALPEGIAQTCVTSPPYWGLRSYGTDPQVWGGEPECDHQLHAAPPGKVLTGGTGEASSKQVSNAGSQYGNAWSETIPFAGSIAGNKTPSGFQQKSSAAHAGALAQIEGHPNGSGQVCSRCGAWRGELGSEPIPDCLAWARGAEPCSTCFVCHIVVVFRAVRRVLHDSGTVFCNLGDSYSGSGKGPTGHNGIGDQGQRQGFVDQRSPDMGLGPKQLLMMPARVALALQADGWVLRSDIIWSKPNPMPESVTDRPTKAHEYLFLLSKRADYYYDGEAVREPAEYGRREWSNAEAVLASATMAGDTRTNHGVRVRSSVTGGDPPAGRNRRSVWTIPTEAYPGSHFATFPRKLVAPCIRAGTSARGQCPQCGAPWRRVVERERNGECWINPKATQTQYGGRGTERLGPGIQDHAQTTGWQPTCPCPPHDPVPQVVLDCFAGSGTSLYVARHHARRAIGIELNEDYARLAADRLKQGTLGLEIF